MVGGINLEPKKTQCYINVDEEGNVRNGQQGQNIIPDEDWDFFFLIDEEINLELYKVIVNKLKKELVKKER